MQSSTVACRVAVLLACVAAVSLPAQSPAPPSLTADDLFNADALHDISLTVNTRDWAELKERYRENAYYLADLRWRDQVVRNIGIRSRGAASRSATKPGLRLDFDRYSSEQEFLGLKSLVLDNLTQDPSMLKERVMMRFYNEMGIAAPRVVNARLFVNNQLVGLYGVVEPIDKRFLQRHFNENDGYLFEFHYTDRYGFEYLGSELEKYAEFFEPKTHEHDSVAALYRPIRELTWAISESSGSVFVSAVSEYLDLRTFLTQLAVENFLADNDSLLGAWGMNNFYLYRFEGKMLSQLIPWDKDSSFQAADYDIWTNVETNTLARRALSERALVKIYLDALSRCAELALRPADRNAEDGDVPDPNAGAGWLERQVSFVHAQIRAAAVADKTKPFSNDRFEDEVSKVLEFSRTRPGYIRRETQNLQ